MMMYAVILLYISKNIFFDHSLHRLLYKIVYSFNALCTYLFFLLSAFLRYLFIASQAIWPTYQGSALLTFALKTTVLTTVVACLRSSVVMQSSISVSQPCLQLPSHLLISGFDTMQSPELLRRRRFSKQILRGFGFLDS